MKNNFILWVIISLVIMLALPWLAVSFVKGDAGMAVCFCRKKSKKVMGNASHFSSIIPAWFMDFF